MSVLSLIALVALGATADNDVEWNGVSHIGHADRRPLCPIGGESFEARLQAYRGDLTGVRVRVDRADEGVSFVDAVIVDSRGPFDFWSASIPTTTGDTLSYWFEVIDGSDTDFYSTSGMSNTTPTSGFAIDYSDLSHAPYGATMTSDGGAVFRVWAPGSTTCEILLSNNGYTPQAIPQLGDDFVGHLNSVPRRTQYRVRFDGTLTTTDPRARGLNPQNGLTAIVEDPFFYDWQNNDFTVPPFEELVIYQLHVGTFSGFNDPLGNTPNPARYFDVANRAGHLAELGVNAVMLNPITEFPFDYSAGYNPITQYAPENAYGTPDQLKAMVDALHAEGIAVFLDVVWNHNSGTDNFMWNYNGTQIYFDTPEVETPWGPQLDLDHPQVRSYYLDSVLTWLEEYRMDGFRMDGTDFINIGEHGLSGWTLMQDLNRLADTRRPDAFIFAEQLPDDEFVTRPTDIGGAGFDSQYYDNFTDRLHHQIIAMSFGDPSMGTLANIQSGSGQYLSQTRAVNYVELHDEAWPTSGGQRLVRTIDTTPPHDDEFAMGRTKLAQSFVMTSPGVPAMLMGTEWLESQNFGSSGPGGEDRLDWSKKTTFAGIFEYYKAIVELRTTNPALRSDAGHDAYHVNDDFGNVMAWQRFDSSGNVLVMVANFSNTDFGTYRIGLPQGGTWAEILNSQSTTFLGDGPVNGRDPFEADAQGYDGKPFSAELAVAAMGFMVLQWNPPAICAADFNNDGVGSVLDLLDFLTAWFANDLDADFNDSGDVSVLDLLDFLEVWFAGC